AAELWRQAHSGSDRRSLARRGHWRRAAMLAEPGPEDDLARARWAFDAGRFRRALMLCAGRSESEARVLGLLARSQLGEFTAVRRALPGFEEMDLDVGQTLEVAETACRAWANAGRARQ